MALVQQMYTVSLFFLHHTKNMKILLLRVLWFSVAYSIFPYAHVPFPPYAVSLCDCNVDSMA